MRTLQRPPVKSTDDRKHDDTGVRTLCNILIFSGFFLLKEEIKNAHWDGWTETFQPFNSVHNRNGKSWHFTGDLFCTSFCGSLHPFLNYSSQCQWTNINLSAEITKPGRLFLHHKQLFPPEMFVELKPSQPQLWPSIRLPLPVWWPACSAGSDGARLHSAHGAVEHIKAARLKPARPPAFANTRALCLHARRHITGRSPLMPTHFCCCEPHATVGNITLFVCFNLCLSFFFSDFFFRCTVNVWSPCLLSGCVYTCINVQRKPDTLSVSAVGLQLTIFYHHRFIYRLFFLINWLSVHNITNGFIW